VLFAREGAKVLCADVNEDAANETVEIIRQENGTANAVCADVTSHDDIRRMVKARTDLFMAGSMSSITTSASRWSEASWNCLKRSGTGYSP
jgi:NAD(P)-dependent dehydrogenase (short-subunit alcohol dehydrogenase family)